jgi:protein O-GlcNAc transferase
VPAGRPDPGARRFISLNHFAKLNDVVIAVWAEILRALPDWTLHLKSRGGDDAAVSARLRGRFAQQGVAPGRIECSGYAPVAEALDAYRDAAIALDPFPFSGGANSYDALWMGLPLVTWPRTTLISRQGATMLHALGQDEWIAGDAKSYVAIACGLAADPAARARWSAMAAADVNERLSDAALFAADLIAALERAWQLRADDRFAAVSPHRC